MEALMKAMQESFANMGIEAEAGPDYIRLERIEFYCNHYRRGFAFCGRWYKVGDTVKAVCDLLLELPAKIRQREEHERRARCEATAKELTKQLGDPDIKVMYYKGKFVFSYTTDDIATITTLAERVAIDTQKAADDAWNEILSTTVDGTYNVKFTAEGGFSLN